ncbi:hypothetical protein VP01_2861g4 [Puccinia sorghi]|uniref:GAG-pre-integrase domain-containing protein n=1 Tax=Puccinia sorghi TaxID=27349 RepID=A0A0L6V1X1_9BASI|nr:hypothetical protein VP01_2861g4 [Puccinia sorghi]
MADAGANTRPPNSTVRLNDSTRNDGFRQAILKAALDTTPQLTERNYSVWKDKMSEDAVNSFITEVRVSIKKMIDVVIDLPKDILAYLVLFKFPALLQLLKRKIMHSEKDLKVKFVCNHLTQFNDEAKAETREAALYTGKNEKFNKNMRNSKSGQNQGSSGNKKNSRCTEGSHNPRQDSNHSSDLCWNLHPEKAPDWWRENQEKWKSNKDKTPGQKQRQHVHIALLGTKGPFVPSKEMCAHCLHFGSGENIIINLFSPGCLDEKRCSVSAKNGQFKVLKSSQLVLQGSVKNGLYSVDKPTSIGNTNSILLTYPSRSLQEIHESFGHVAISRLDSFIPKTISVEEK